MSAPTHNAADHPLPLSPEVNLSPLPTLPLALPVPDDDLPSHAHSHEHELENSHVLVLEHEPGSAGVDFTSPPPASPGAEEIISSLRTSLEAAQLTVSTQSTRLSALSDVETDLAQLRDQYAFLSAAKEAVENQLHEETKKREVAEENVEMLRGQVEQARRGVMVLQKQDADRKRMSVMSGGTTGLGLGEEEVLNFGSMGEPTTTLRDARLSKRQSIIRPHRRQSSQSEPADVYIDRPVVSPNAQSNNNGGGASGTAGNTLRPGGHGLRELRLGSTPPSATLPSPNVPLNNPALSGYFDDQLPLTASTTATATTGAVSSKKVPDSPSKTEIEAVEEVNRLRADLIHIQIKLAESEEARMASETCLKALREFMAGGNDDGKTAAEGGAGGSGLEGEQKDGNMTASTADLLKGIRLPPLPTDRETDEEELEAQKAAAAADKAKANSGGWGFKLWNAKAPAVTSPNRELPAGSASATSQNTSPQKALSPIADDHGRSRAGSTATINSNSRFAPSPLPTPGDETASINTATSGTQLQTPLSSFVSNWTKSVASPPTPSVSSPQAPGNVSERPGQTRKISVSSFFSRGASSTKKEKETAPTSTVKEEAEKELPTPPETAQLQPSPEIQRTLSLGGSTSGASDVRRESHATTLTDLEDELGTPRSASASGVIGADERDVEAPDAGEREKVKKTAEEERMEGIAL